MRRFFAISCCLAVCALGATVAAQNTQNAPASRGYHSISPRNWSFQCEYDSECGVNGSGGHVWIDTESQPGTVRLWGAGAAWYQLEPSENSYDWANLDLWLDLIAQHEPMTVLYTFGNSPCWIASADCTGTGWSALWSPSPPRDLTKNGSQAFNNFVTQLTRHCSPAGHCVKDYIKVFEMWNEANLVSFWTGTPTQLYDMFKPAVSIIRSNVPKVAVSTPPVVSGKTEWMAAWLSLENTNGRLSDYYGFHVYLDTYTPEKRINMVARMLTTKNENGWSSVPWANTETSFQPYVYTCPDTYTTQECNGMLVRWFVLQYAYDGGSGGAVNVGWFDWPSVTTGHYDTYFYTMMQWLNGARFTGSCTSGGTVYTCPLHENGKSALIVWDTAGNSHYTPGSQFVDYREFNGTYGGKTVSISQGQTTTIGVIPVMFETD